MGTVLTAKKACIVDLVGQVAQGHLGHTCRVLGHLALFVKAHLAQQRVKIGQFMFLLLHGYADGVLATDGRTEERGVLQLAVESMPHRVGLVADRVQVVKYLTVTFCLGTARHHTGIGQVEVAVEIKENLLVSKGLATIRHLNGIAHVLLLHILEPLTAPQRQQQVFLLGSRLKHARVGKDNGLVFIRTGLTVNHHVVESARHHVLVLDIKVGVGNAIVEHTLGNLQFGTLLLHRHQQLTELLVGLGSNDILEIERHTSHYKDNNDDGTHALHQRNAGSLDSRQLGTLAKIAIGYQRRQQNSQRKSLGNKHQSHVPKELGQHIHGKSLADEVIDITPQKLHHQHKLADEKGGDKQQ